MVIPLQFRLEAQLFTNLGNLRALYSKPEILSFELLQYAFFVFLFNEELIAVDDSIVGDFYNLVLVARPISKQFRLLVLTSQHRYVRAVIRRGNLLPSEAFNPPLIVVDHGWVNFDDDPIVSFVFNCASCLVFEHVTFLAVVTGLAPA